MYYCRSQGNPSHFIHCDSVSSQYSADRWRSQYSVCFFCFFELFIPESLQTENENLKEVKRRLESELRRLDEDYKKMGAGYSVLQLSVVGVQRDASRMENEVMTVNQENGMLLEKRGTMENSFQGLLQTPEFFRASDPQSGPKVCHITCRFNAVGGAYRAGKWSRKSTREEYASSGLFTMAAATAEDQVGHRCPRQSELQKKNRKKKKLILERFALRLTLYFDEHVQAKSRPSLKSQSKRSSLWSERGCKYSVVRA